MFRFPRKFRRSTDPAPTSNPIRYRELPLGTILRLVSTTDDHYVAQITSEVFDNRALRVKVLSSPVQYGDPREATYLFAVPPAMRGKSVAEYFAAPIPTLSPGDIVYLVDMLSSALVRPFEVARLTVTLPAR